MPARYDVPPTVSAISGTVDACGFHCYATKTVVAGGYRPVMFLMVDCPDELFADGGIPAAMTGAGVRLEAVEEVPAGPWLAAVLDSVDPRELSEWDLPAYLRASARMQAWAAARVSEGVAELASRPGPFGSDKDIGMALREPVGAAQRRIHHA